MSPPGYILFSTQLFQPDSIRVRRGTSDALFQSVVEIPAGILRTDAVPGQHVVLEVAFISSNALLTTGTKKHQAMHLKCTKPEKLSFVCHAI